MTIEFNHTIIWATDPAASARFLSTALGLSDPVRFARFHVVDVGGGVSLDFARSDRPIQTGHYAFLVSDDSFDAVMGRLVECGVPFWADPFQSMPGRINHADGGRGAYFLDPDGHSFEIITRPYGSSGESS
ncbi:VOC family protein [Sphingomonas sp.]|uniref:VOC family protein n=1 Tax=Sphingomonas sp. TaxID=28214 RepID=UPI000DB55282|nr:VOC family protein [Sphingomonas sp.]PZU09270.1 MAG: bleomycin resistance protein [Sphingomonas sp.]